MLFEEMEAFVRVVDAGSFTAAAKELGVPKSTLSRAVARLEDTLRVRLLERTTRFIALTPEGRALHGRAAPHLSGLREAAAAARATQDEPQGVLRVTAPVDAGDTFLSDLLVRFAERYPLVQLDVDLTDRTVDLVKEGFDVAFRAAPRVTGGNLVARKLAVTEIQLFASPTYLARRGYPETPEDLSLHECVLFRAPELATTWTLEGPGGPRTVPVRGRFSGSSFPFVRAVVRQGAGIGPMPVLLAAQDAPLHRLVRVLPEWSQPGGTIHLVYASSRHLPKKVVAFRDFVLESLPRTILRRGPE